LLHPQRTAEQSATFWKQDICGEYESYTLVPALGLAEARALWLSFGGN
jgi:hypothetical protein